MDERNNWTTSSSPDFAKVYYDEESSEDKDKVDEITHQLGKVGISCIPWGIGKEWYEGRESYPSVPWLKYDGITYYYDYEIDGIVEYIINEHIPHNTATDEQAGNRKVE